MTIALIAHDSKRELMAQFCIAYSGVLKKHTLCATGKTGKAVVDATGLVIQRFMSGEYGGCEQISARIAYNEIDLILFFRDFLSLKGRESPEVEMMRLCDMHNIPLATNIATAEAFIHGLERGDFDWRTIAKPA